MTGTMVLPARLDLTAARRLAADLRGLADGPLVLDASGVETLGGLCLQVLLAARQHWQRGGHPLRCAPRSPAFDEALRQFGVAPSQLESGA